MLTDTKSQVLGLSKKGTDYKGEPIIQTMYNFNLVVNTPNKISFSMVTTTQVIFPSNDYFTFGAHVVDFYDDMNDITTEKLFEKCVEGGGMLGEDLNEEMEKQGIPLFGLSLQPLSKKQHLPDIQAVIDNPTTAEDIEKFKKGEG